MGHGIEQRPHGGLLHRRNLLRRRVQLAHKPHQDLRSPVVRQERLNLDPTLRP